MEENRIGLPSWKMVQMGLGGTKEWFRGRPFQGKVDVKATRVGKKPRVGSKPLLITLALLILILMWVGLLSNWFRCFRKDSFCFLKGEVEIRKVNYLGRINLTGGFPDKIFTCHDKKSHFLS